MADETSQQLAALLRDGQAHLDRGEFARAESLFAEALALAPDEPQAQDGLRRSRLGVGNAAEPADESIDWQAHYDAGADASLDLPPPLSRDLVHDTLSAPMIETDEPPAPEPAAAGRTENPSTDPFLRHQSDFSSPMSVDGDRPVVTRIEVEERASEPPADSDRFADDTEPPASVQVGSEPPAERPVEVALIKPDLTGDSRPGDLLPAIEPEAGYSYDTLEESADIDPGEMELDALLLLAQRRHKAGDFVGASGLLERLLAEMPDHPEGLRLNEENDARLMKTYEERLGDLERCPKLRLRQEEFVWQSLNHHEGFVLSQVDGMTSYSDLIEISTLPRLDVVRILARLVELGTIG